MHGCFWANILVVYEFLHPFPLNYNFGTLAVGLGSFPFDNGTCLSLSDSCFYIYGILSLIVLGNLVGSLTHSVLYLHILLNKASPKAISRRTSYLRVRLEFLRYPQVIPKLFNAYGFGPPLDFTQASTCSWIGHSVSGLFHMTSFALFRLDFSSTSYLKYLILPYKITRRTVLQKVRHRTLTCFVCL